MRAPLAALTVCALLAGRAAADNRHFNDAALHAVQFFDAKEGWAVGDAGTVWHTIDGGQTWERQPTGVNASLRSLHFLDAFRGWVAGREELPGGGSAGVLLYTSDGGETWKRVLGNAVPGLNHVRFGDAKNGYALGDGSDQFPTGVFRTADGGRSWQPVKGPRSPGWLTGDFASGTTGALAGAWARLATIRDGDLGTARIDPLGIRGVRGLMVRGDRALAVGQGGLLLASTSGGEAWGFATLKLPPDVLAAWDFHALHGVGDHVWAVGRPGSVALHSPDGGATWEMRKTGQPLPLNGIFFFDERRGWAVGELGTILATTDGGKTWTAQRRGGRRAGAMFVSARGEGLPVEALSVVGLEAGHLTACVRVAAPDPRSEAPSLAAASQRFAAAARRAGAAAGEMLWQFPLPRHLSDSEKADLLSAWTRIHGAPADRQLLRQLVLALRVWRPDVVVADRPDAALSGSPEALTAEALREALKQAADPAAFPEQIQQLGLEAWKAHVAYTVGDRPEGAAAVVDGNEDRPRLGTAARDFAEPAGALLSDTPLSLPPQRYFRLLVGEASGAARRDLMAGAPAGEVGVSRRSLPQPTDLGEEAARAAKARRQLRALAEAQATEMADPERVLALLGPSLKGLPDDQGAAALLAIARSYARQGRWPLARETYQLMAERYPAYPRTVEAYRWLVAYQASGEARRRLELQHEVRKTEATVEMRRTDPKQIDFKDFPGGAAAQIAGLPTMVGKQKVVHLTSGKDTRDWLRQAVEFGKRLGEFGPLHATDPAVQFTLQSARRRLGEIKEAQEYYAWFQLHQVDGPWREAAAAEQWVSSPSGQPPRPVTVARKSPKRPYLDGKFDDDCWQGIKPMILRNAAEDTLKDYPTEARFAYDADFLYVALTCRHPAGKGAAPVKGRQRDADLRAFDRVSILIDLDRDYQTYYQLQVDQRGCACEDCWGDRSWNPQWFVAAHPEDGAWHVEAAIPLKELTGERPTTGTVWGCNVVRILPGRGVQGWSLPAGVEPRPEGMGLLYFRPDLEREPRPMQRLP